MNKTLSALLTSHRRLAFALTGLIVAGALVAARAPGESSPVAVRLDPKPVNRGALEPASYSTVAKRVAPSVVTITTVTKARNVAMNSRDFSGIPDPFFRQFFGQQMPQMRAQPQNGLGSGVIISADGYIVTNNHVVDGADSVSVSLDDGRELKAKVIGRDPKTDIAVVKVDAKDLPAISFTESAKAEVGDRVLAIGNPFGIGETVTTGIVSAKGRRPGLGLDYEDFIQTDAAINPGNSGGALVDIDGRLIGINTAILTRSGGFQGVGLAVPSDLVRNVVDQLVRSGKVVRGFIGVNIQSITPALAESFGLKDRNGALVADVTAGSPAAKAGLQDGDVITAVDGKTVNDAGHLRMVVSQTAPGTKLTLSVLRDGKTEKIDVTTGTAPNQKRNRRQADDQDNLAGNQDTGVLNGVAVGELDAQTRRQFNIPERLRGAVVTEVAPDSAAARAGLQPGDVILEINRHPVTTAEEAVKLSEDDSNKKTRLKVWSRGGTIYMVVDETDEKTL
ncbi:MAG: DegQ family serine endoprotease [Opitutae bacterium]|nr:DegQ family serine endoprotease [Opitutae bacterium]